MTVATFTQPNYGETSGTAYPVSIDHSVMVMRRIGAAFAAHESDPVAMTVTVDAGAVVASGQPVEVAAQTTGTITAPSSDPRIDRVVVDAATGTAEVVQGAEAADPDPPSIPAGKLPVCQVALTVGMTEITNADLTDERVGAGSGGGFTPGAPSELTLEDGAIEPTGPYHTVDTEADSGNPDGVAAGTLEVIGVDNLAVGALLVLAAEDAARVVTLSGEGTGSNLNLQGDFVLDSLDKRIVLQRRGAAWDEVARSYTEIPERAYALLQDQRTSGTDGPSYTSGAWRTVILNIEVSDPANVVSLSSSQFTLVAGRYSIRAASSHGASAAHVCRLRIHNVTANSTIAAGPHAGSGSNAVAVVNPAIETGEFTANGTDAYELQVRVTGNGGGAGAISSGNPEVYASVLLERVR